MVVCVMIGAQHLMAVMPCFISPATLIRVPLKPAALILSTPIVCSLMGYLSASCMWLSLGLSATAQAQSPPELQSVSWTSGANIETLSAGGIRKNAGGSSTWNAGAKSSLHLLRIMQATSLAKLAGGARFNPRFAIDP